MDQLMIEIERGEASFEPGAEIQGTVRWILDTQPEEIDLRLFWFTRGKGTTDTDIVSELHFDRPNQEETREFRFRLPNGPYSFSGKLISLVWALELVVEPSELTERKEFVVAPNRREIQLYN